MKPHELAQAYEDDKAPRDPALTEKLSTSQGRLAHAHTMAMTRSPEYRKVYEHTKAGTTSEVDFDTKTKAQEAREEFHMLTLLYYFGPMKTEHIAERMATDMAEELKRLCDEELERRRSSRNEEAGGTDG